MNEKALLKISQANARRFRLDKSVVALIESIKAVILDERVENALDIAALFCGMAMLLIGGIEMFSNDYQRATCHFVLALFCGLRSKSK